MKVRLCPLCGAPALDLGSGACCSSEQHCPLSATVFDKDQWNTMADKVDLAEEALWQEEVYDLDMDSRTTAAGRIELCEMRNATHDRADELLRRLQEEK